MSAGLLWRQSAGVASILLWFAGCAATPADHVTGTDRNPPMTGGAGVNGSGASADMATKTGGKKTDAREPDAMTYIPDAFLGDPRCESAGLMFCDDFERGVVDTRKWKIDFSGAAGSRVIIEKTQAARGLYSAHVKIPNTG